MDSKEPKNSEWVRFYKSFQYAWNGIVSTFKSERNFQIHVSISIIMFITGMVLRFSIIEWMIVLFLIGGMMALELINTAIEHVVDMITSEMHPLAKAAKDAAAGAVLVYAILSFIIGIILITNHLFAS
ncbi:diacylglycerol kinase family protein [Metabacillus halosaccharovorans]|uniref:Diacylglycerol kinase family protein n=1 Tax=Metabacillus halosaccharovorans TaxID=930124 RepID=A0ABT3DCW3_9BACI|nr:diacylglycerol kinase family protein [Metabacillus halosaccharovorans]MCV9884894.1 diacylglycerol kinase family protein [Metabacillus halosaccharovorans]